MQAVNPQTGEVFELRGGRWVKVGDATSSRKPSEPLPTLSHGTLDAMLFGAGDVMATVGRNVRDVVAGVRGDTARQAEIEAERQEAGELRQRVQGERPIATAVGGALPGLATLPLGAGIGIGRLGMAGAPVLQGTLGRAGLQVGLGAAEGALTEAGGDMGGGAGLGAALGAAGTLAGNIVGRVQAARGARQGVLGDELARELGMSGRMAGALNEGEQAAVEAGRRAGLTVLPGQATGSRQARQLEASLASNPATSRIFQEIEQANQAQLNTLAARAMGEQADNVGPAVRARAEMRLDGTFGEIGQRLGAVQTEGLAKRLQVIADEDATAALPTGIAATIRERFAKGAEARAKAVGAAPGELPDVISGEALTSFRSQATKNMRDAFATGRSERGQVFAQIVDAIDETIRRHAVANGDLGLAEVYDRARQQWSVLRAMDRGGASAEGNVLAGQAARLMAQSDKGGYVRLGQTGAGELGVNPLGDFYDGLRFKSSQIGRPIVGDSGTATRSAIGQWLQGGSTMGTAANVLGKAAQRVAIAPPVQAYANMSPEAARMTAATLAAMRAQQAGATGLGGIAGRLAGVLGGGQ